MASYDSDSSDDDSLDVQTNVTLGYAAEAPAGDEISHVGGHPTWLDGNVKPSADFAKCKICNNYMSLLLQLQADLQQQFPDDERRLFVWCCRKKQCWRKNGSIKAFREVKKAKPRKTQTPRPQQQANASQPQTNLGNQLFSSPSSPPPSQNLNPSATSSSTMNPFSVQPATNSNPLSDLAAKSPQPPTQSFAQKLTISSSKPESQPQPNSDPWPPNSSFPPPLPHFYLDAEAEYLEPDTKPTAESSSSNTGYNSRITELEDDGPSSAAAEKDLYESPHDKTFSHFTKILAQNPEQILRYEFGGSPLLYSSADQVATHFVLPGHQLHQKVKMAGPVKGIPNCRYCGAARVFEMQLVPCLIFELEKDNEEALKLDGQEGMEWGTIIVGCCSKNCGDEAEGKVVFREEWVGVQWEENVDKKQRQ